MQLANITLLTSPQKMVERGLKNKDLREDTKNPLDLSLLKDQSEKRIVSLILYPMLALI